MAFDIIMQLENNIRIIQRRIKNSTSEETIKKLMNMKVDMIRLIEMEKEYRKRTQYILSQNKKLTFEKERE